jgi:thioester reductase-like protein
MRLPFCILNVAGDVLDDGELFFVEAAQSLDAARARVRSLVELLPGEFVIYDEATGERVSVTAGDKPH